MTQFKPMKSIVSLTNDKKAMKNLIELMETGQDVTAIKFVRKRSDLTLKEAVLWFEGFSTGFYESRDRYEI